MLRQCTRHHVEILEHEHVSPDGKRMPKTALVTLYDNKNEIIYTREYGHMPTEGIYQMIDKKEELNLNNCYIKNFSLSAYRRSRLIEKGEYIDIESLTAKNAIFDSYQQTDFSFARFRNSEINFTDSIFVEGCINFHAAQFEDSSLNMHHCYILDGKMDFVNVKFTAPDASIDFKNARMGDGVKDFQYAHFDVKEMIFANAEFGRGEISFINANFYNSKVNFKIARFDDGHIDFHFARFGESDLSFERTEFGDGMVDFRTVEFGQGKVNFNRSVFGKGNIDFEASQLLKGRLTFKRVEFDEGDINFELCEYENADIIFEKSEFTNAKVSFLNGKFKKINLGSCHLNSYIDLRVASCREIDLSNTVVRDIIDLKPFDFQVKIGVLNFSGMRLLGRLYLDWDENQLKRLILQQSNTDVRAKAEQFRILKENFNHTGQYSDEDKAYVMFKRYEGKSLLRQHISKGRLHMLWAGPLHAMRLVIFDWMGLYATNPVRVLISMVSFFLLFSFIYMGILASGSESIVSGIGGEHAELGIVPRSLYHSAITFLTIGYGDYYPFGIVRVLSGLEGFVGLFLMSYFTVAFVRNILR